MMMIIIASFSVVVPLFSSAQEIFPGLSEMKQVESTYISGRFSQAMPVWRSNSGKHALDLKRGFSSLFRYEIYSKEALDKARKMLNDYIKKNPDLELVMSTKQMMGEYLVYEKFNKDGELLQLVLLDSEGPNLGEIVVINWDSGLDRGSDSPYNDSTSEIENYFFWKHG